MRFTPFQCKITHTESHPGRLAIVGNGGSCTYEELQKGIRGLEKRLRKMGVEKGSRVALWSCNSANWLIAFFAVIRTGGTAVLLNYSMNSADAAELLIMTETGFLLCGDNRETKKNPDAMHTLAALAGIPEEHCLDIRPAVMDPGRVFRDDPAEDMPDASEENATAFILFTSGTTSRPKAVQISQKALAFDADAFNGNVGEYAGRSVCVAAPLFHMLGLLMSYAYPSAGDIRVKITLMPEWLRIAFSDHGAEYYIDKRRDTSASAKIILKAVSDFHTDYSDGKPVYCMDFLYENDFSITDFLMKNKEEIGV